MKPDQNKKLLFFRKDETSLDSIIKAAYSTMDLATFIIDGDPEHSIVVEIIPKKGTFYGAKQEFVKKLNMFNNQNKSSSSKALSEELMHLALIKNGKTPR